ncbi:hypothetical protein A4H97_16565 [Niastella yeongjuensis]|uniref:Uncharacterized protein n=1 Tax=Niastella yeongjuensis TaxID=354355 RepID=A0A1V9E1C8_9BACT|nr:hypothetical protein A4H97_16565 [Niastella yeongjuensis]
MYFFGKLQFFASTYGPMATHRLCNHPVANIYVTIRLLKTIFEPFYLLEGCVSVTPVCRFVSQGE